MANSKFHSSYYCVRVLGAEFEYRTEDMRVPHSETYLQSGTECQIHAHNVNTPPAPVVFCARK